MTATTDLDAILRGWLSEGADRAPVEPLRTALEETASMPQRRRAVLPFLTSSNIDRPSSRLHAVVLLAAVVILIAATVGVAVQIGIIRIDPEPGPNLLPLPSESIGPSEEAEQLRTFRSDDGTYEIRLPAAWSEATGPDQEAMYLSGGSLRLSIRAADADGRVRTCDAGAGPWETCLNLDESTDSLDELGSAIGLSSTPEAGVAPNGPIRSSMTLDGEPAKVERIDAYEHPARGGESVKYVVSMHNGRAFVLRFWTPSQGGIGPANQLLAGFSFIDSEAFDESTQSPAPTPVPGPNLATFRAPDDSFEIRLPIAWSMREGPDPSAIYLRNGRTSMSIRAGDGDGQLRACDSIDAAPFESCPMITATTLEDLADAIAVSEGAYPHLGPNAASLILGGEPATSITVVSGVAPPIGVVYVVATHEGRPFIVRARQDRPADDLNDVLREIKRFSFRSPLPFSSTDPNLTLEPYANADLGFQLLVPSIWADAERVGRSYVLEGSAVSFPGERAEGPPALRIHVGEPGTSTLADLEELLESACPVYDEIHSYRFLDGEIAGVETTEDGNNCIGYPGSRYHVYAIHDGRPIVLEFDYWLYEFGRLALRDESWRLVEAIVDSFEFTDGSP